MFREAKISEVLLLIFLALAASGCSHVSYLVQAGLGQLSLYNHERPLDEAVRDPRVKSDVRERLAWIPEIKKLVQDDLEIKATSNYTTYVQLDRPYVIWSTTVAEPYEMKQLEWSFPIVGSFPYLGFFKEEGARDWANEWTEKGYDAYVRGVTAYSTLGYLRDPMLSSMLSRSKADMVNLIYHESTHGQIYLKGQGPFNEQVASYVGDMGERNWLKKTYGEQSDEARDWENDRADRRLFGLELRRFADELKVFYADSKGLSVEDRKRGKDERYAAFRKRLEEARWKGRGMRRAAKLITNNAALLAFLTYEDEQDLFDLLEKKCGGSLKGALRYLKGFAMAWDRSKSEEPVATPQQLLRAKLTGEGGGDAVLCIGLDANSK